MTGCRQQICEVDPWNYEDREDGEQEDLAQLDAEFIANAPTDIAWLVGEVERLREEK